jgi:hypothetical protein
MSIRFFTINHQVSDLNLLGDQLVGFLKHWYESVKVNFLDVYDSDDAIATWRTRLLSAAFAMGELGRVAQLLLVLLRNSGAYLRHHLRAELPSVEQESVTDVAIRLGTRLSEGDSDGDSEGHEVRRKHVDQLREV